MRELPKVETLREAVREIIESNIRDGYPPHRFIQATEGGNAADLGVVCERLINKAETLEWLEGALERIPTLLTLEDFVSRQGSEWGMSVETVEAAKARVERFDEIAGTARYS
jgi:SRSO17 transposase